MATQWKINKWLKKYFCNLVIVLIALSVPLSYWGYTIYRQKEGEQRGGILVRSIFISYYCLSSDVLKK